MAAPITLEDCVGIIVHHIDSKKINLIEACGMLTRDVVAARFSLVERKLNIVLKQLIAVREAASQADCSTVLEVLNADLYDSHMEITHGVKPSATPDSSV